MDVTVFNCVDVRANGTCGSGSYVTGYLLTPEAGASADLFLTGGVDIQSLEIGFGAMLFMFATGFGVGLIIAQLRKLRV